MGNSTTAGTPSTAVPNIGTCLAVFSVKRPTSEGAGSPVTTLDQTTSISVHTFVSDCTDTAASLKFIQCLKSIPFPRWWVTCTMRSRVWNFVLLLKMRVWLCLYDNWRWVAFKTWELHAPVSFAACLGLYSWTNLFLRTAERLPQCNCNRSVDFKLACRKFDSAFLMRNWNWERYNNLHGEHYLPLF